MPLGCTERQMACVEHILCGTQMVVCACLLPTHVHCVTNWSVIEEFTQKCDLQCSILLALHAHTFAFKLTCTHGTMKTQGPRGAWAACLQSPFWTSTAHKSIFQSVTTCSLQGEWQLVTEDPHLSMLVLG